MTMLAHVPAAADFVPPQRTSVRLLQRTTDSKKTPSANASAAESLPPI
jgi:hypothetical protein